MTVLIGVHGTGEEGDGTGDASMVRAVDGM
jgi:hypothetical protein